VMREAFAADLLGTAAFTHGVDKLDPIGGSVSKVEMALFILAVQRQSS
jgi:hypothetical protein